MALEKVSLQLLTSELPFGEHFNPKLSLHIYLVWVAAGK